MYAKIEKQTNLIISLLREKDITENKYSNLKNKNTEFEIIELKEGFDFAKIRVTVGKTMLYWDTADFKTSASLEIQAPEPYIYDKNTNSAKFAPELAGEFERYGFEGLKDAIALKTSGEMKNNAICFLLDSQVTKYEQFFKALLKTNPQLEQTVDESPRTDMLLDELLRQPDKGRDTFDNLLFVAKNLENFKENCFAMPGGFIVDGRTQWDDVTTIGRDNLHDIYNIITKIKNLVQTLQNCNFDTEKKVQKTIVNDAYQPGKRTEQYNPGDTETNWKYRTIEVKVDYNLDKDSQAIIQSIFTRDWGFSNIVATDAADVPSEDDLAHLNSILDSVHNPVVKSAHKAEVISGNVAFIDKEISARKKKKK